MYFLCVYYICTYTHVDLDLELQDTVRLRGLVYTNDLFYFREEISSLIVD